MIVEKAVNMAKMMNIPVLGIVENMSWIRLPGLRQEHLPLRRGQDPRGSARRHSLPPAGPAAHSARAGLRLRQGHGGAVQRELAGRRCRRGGTYRRSTKQNKHRYEARRLFWKKGLLPRIPFANLRTGFFYIMERTHLHRKAFREALYGEIYLAPILTADGIFPLLAVSVYRAVYDLYAIENMVRCSSPVRC